MLRLGAILFLMSANSYGNNFYLKPEDQKYFKNDSMEGKNNLERIDANVKEINRLHSELAALKAQMQELRRDVDELKNKK